MKNIISGPKTPAAAAVKFIEVDEESAGQRLDNFLLRQLKGVPKTHVYRIIRSGEVRLNKGRASADSRVATGDTVRLPPVRVGQRPAQPALPNAPAREFPLLLEDEALIALDKPAGTAVHGGSGVSFGVIEQLRRARPEARFLELVHRLDRETSGILLVAKKRSVLRQLQDQFRARETGKTYLALVVGEWPAAVKRIDKPLQRYIVATPGGHGEGERRVRVAGQDEPEAQRAISLVKVVQRLPGHTLLAVTIKTGRTHQIRVHLASQGHPIAGDDKYGQSDTNKTLTQRGLRRMFLHAWQLQFDHPVHHERVALQAELPAELQKFLHDVASTPL